MDISPPQWKMRNFMEESKGALFFSPHRGIPYDTTRQRARPFWCSLDACVDSIPQKHKFVTCFI